jgi:hypothetical protein
MGTTKLRERIEMVQAIANTQTGDRLELSPKTGRPRFAEIVDDPRIADGLVVGAALMLGTVQDVRGNYLVNNGKTVQRFSKATAKLIMLDHFGAYTL